MHASDDQTLLSAADQCPHFVRSITEVGERQDVVAHDDIYAANGIKLVAKGAKIDRSKLERLTEHKLKIPLDLLLSAENTLNRASLAADVEHALSEDTVLAQRCLRATDLSALKEALAQIVLAPPVAFRLTVMRDDRPVLYRHTLRVTVVAQALAQRLGFDQRQHAHMLLAALLHDVGEMHTDPALLAPGRRLEGIERGHVYVHPVTSQVVLQQMKVLPADVVQAVAQHHERMDGSGYPLGLQGHSIGRLARVLGVAEMHDYPVRDGGPARLHVILRLNRHRFDAPAIDALLDLLGVPDDAGSVDRAWSEAARYLTRLARAFRAWPGLSGAIAANPDSPLRFVLERVNALRALMLQAGVDSELLTALDFDGDDAGVLRELLMTLDEVRHMLNELLFEILRRTGDAVTSEPTAGRLVAVLQDLGAEPG